MCVHCLMIDLQEWVDFDFEMRLYFLPPPEWPAEGSTPIEPKMIQCNAWGPSDDTKAVGVSRASFSKLLIWKKKHPGRLVRTVSYFFWVQRIHGFLVVFLCNIKGGRPSPFHLFFFGGGEVFPLTQEV